MGDGNGEATDSVLVARAPSGLVLLSSAVPELVVGRRLSDLAEADDFAMFHPDGRRYAPAEWQLARSIATGEVIVDEEFFRVGPDGGRKSCRISSYPVYESPGRMRAAVSIAHVITGRDRVETDLAHHASLLHTLDDAVVGTDPQFRLTVWNRGAERLYGYPADEVLGRPAREVAGYPGDRSRLGLERELLESDRARTEITAYRKDGTPVEVELISVAVRDDHGALSGYLGIHRDISECKRGEEALRESQHRIETILDSISDEFFVLDREWRYTYINKRGAAQVSRIPGRDLTAADVLGSRIWELFPQLVGTTFDQAVHRALHEQTVMECEEWSPVTKRCVEARIYPSQAGVSIHLRDITQRKRAEEERDRRAYQQRLVAELGLRALAADGLQAVLDEAVETAARGAGVTPVGIAEILPDREELVLRAGVGWREGDVGAGIGSSGRGSLMGHTVMTGGPVVSEDLAADPRCELSPFLRSYAPVSASTVLIAGRREPFGVLAAFSPVRRSFSPDDNNFLQAVANVVSTAVEREQTERRIREVRQAERRRIARDLHDEALQDLTDALARATTLAGSQAAGEAAVDLARLAASLKRAGQQVRGAIYDLRLGAEARRSFRDLLEELIDVQQQLTPDIRIELDVSGQFPDAVGRVETALLRVTGEALVNARRHAGAGVIRVEVWASDGHLCAKVTDDGRGFEAGSERLLEGTGIRGMRERAELVKGELEIDSAAGAGTTVLFSVPRADETEVTEQPSRVLLVEDHVAVREAVAAMVQSEPDFDVVWQAGSLADARAGLQDVDIAVIDLALPDGYGGDLIRELREVNPRAQAVVLTAGLDRVELARAVEIGAAGALDKSISVNLLLDALRRVRAGETLLPLEEIVELLRFAGRRREQEYEDRQSIESLTPREREVLQLLADGFDSQAIADRLHISVRTQRNHVANILSKLGVHSQIQALVFALRYGAVEVR